MNKSDAANFLGKTERAIERYVKDGRLSARYVAGKTRSVADFDEAELERLKHELDNPSDVRPAIVSLTPTNAEQPRQSATNALQRAGNIPDGAMLVSMLMEAANAPHAPCMLLSVKDAAEFSGLSASRIVRAIHDGQLDGRKIGRGFKLRPVDVSEFVRQVFDDAERYGKPDAPEDVKNLKGKGVAKRRHERLLEK
jgi:excisionase family DNA binding protein